MRVGEFQFAGHEDLFNEKMATERLGVVTLHVFRVMRIACFQLHV